MEFNIESKYNVGDELYVWRFIARSKKPSEWHMGYEKLKISHIRAMYSEEGWSIDYFFEGIEPYAGKYWFNEANPYPECEAIFATEEEAKEMERQYLEKYKKDETDDE